MMEVFPLGRPFMQYILMVRIFLNLYFDSDSRKDLLHNIIDLCMYCQFLERSRKDLQGDYLCV